MESLLQDILLDIFYRVPVESVLDCKLVCKRWLTLIHDSETYFTNMHFSHQLNYLYGGDDNNITVPSLLFAGRRENNNLTLDAPTLLYHGRQINDKITNNENYSFKENLKRINHPPLRDYLVGSCNGLICTCIRHHRVKDPIYIFNPVTREYVYLPQLVVEPSADMVNLIDGVSCGFGYVRSTNEYKVVRIHYPYRSMYKGHVEVYTLGSGCGWRSKGTTPSCLINWYLHGAGIHVNGAIYWRGQKNVVSFDLADEEFCLLPFPPCMSNYIYNKNDAYVVVALGGHLCFYLETVLRLEIWSLKKRGSDMKEIWCLDFKIDYQGVRVIREKTWFRPILLTENKELILIFWDEALCYYDLKTKTLKGISDDKEVSTGYFTHVEAIPHIHTFASLEAMGEKSKRYLVNAIWEDNNEMEQLEVAS